MEMNNTKAFLYHLVLSRQQWKLTIRSPSVCLPVSDTCSEWQNEVQSAYVCSQMMAANTPQQQQWIDQAM